MNAEPSSDEGQITSDDYSVLLQIITWLLLITTCLAVAARFGTKRALKRTISEADDGFVAASSILSVAQAVILAIAASNGLGMSASLFSTQDQLQYVEKLEYASDLLRYVSLALSRLAFLSLIMSTTADQARQLQVLVLGAVVVIWCLVSLFPSAFQCDLPRAWDFTGSHCINRVSWFIAHDAIDAILDSSLIALSTLLLISLRSRLSKKLAALFYFSLRALVVAAAICGAVFWSRLRDSTNLIRDTWPTIICAQCVQSLSIITVSALYLKPFMEMLQSGFVRFDNTEPQGSRSHKSGFSHRLSISSKRLKQFSPRRVNTDGLGTLHETAADEHGWASSSQEGRENVTISERPLCLDRTPRGVVESRDAASIYLESPGNATGFGFNL